MRSPRLEGFQAAQARGTLIHLNAIRMGRLYSSDSVTRHGTQLSYAKGEDFRSRLAREFAEVATSIKGVDENAEERKRPS